MRHETHHKDEGLGQDPKMGEIVRSGGEARNAGEVDPGVESDELVGDTDEATDDGPESARGGASQG